MDSYSVLTFDYEVFMGQQTGSIDACVIKPTQLILDVLRKNHAKAIFFTDGAWLLFLKENLPFQFQIVAKQLDFLIKSGSSVELHLHPQWKDAIRVGNEIKFKTYQHYRLQSLSKNEIVDLFIKSTQLIEEITNQKVTCFRAGGWCIEPFKKIKAAFETCNIEFDFSIIPQAFLKDGKVYDYDFTNAPKLRFYRFQNSPCLKETNGHFIEIPASSYMNNPIYRILNKLALYIRCDNRLGDGKSIQEQSSSFFNSLYRHLQISTVACSIDSTSNLFFRYLLKTHLRNSSPLVIISHSKAISKMALKNLEYLTKHYITLNTRDLKELIMNPYNFE